MTTNVDVEPDTTAGQVVYPYVVHGVEPRDLRAEGNSRVVGDIREQRPDLVASVAENGLNPMVSVINVAPDPDGVLEVLVGFHRHAAAVAVTDKENPELVLDVLVHAPGTTRQDVLVAQGIENFHREGYTQAEEAGLYDQLALEGLDEDAIAHQLTRPVERVRAGRAVAASSRTHTASEALPDTDLLTLSQLAEFADDEAAHQALVDVLRDRPHNFEWTIGRLRRERDQRTALAEESQRLTELGYAIFDERDVPEDAVRLDELCSGPDTEPIDPVGHADCPGRAASVWVDRLLEVEITEYCLDHAAHGHRLLATVRAEEAEARLRADGVPIADPDADGMADLSALFADAGRPLTAEEHADCPGHAAHVEADPDRSTAEVRYVCTDYATHGHLMQTARDTQSELDAAWQAAERKRAAENNKAWRDAKTDRREWLTKYFTGWRKRKPAALPQRVHHWLALAPVLASDHLAEAAPAHRYACTLLGLAEPEDHRRDRHPIAVHLRKKTTTETQAVLIRLAQVIGACEQHWDRAYTSQADASWRRPTDGSRFYFELLEALGYPLSHVEQLVNQPDLDIEKWPHLAKPEGAT
ncbi:hypothetical protein AB8O55_24745 [Saccharopolyspora cebuensis]|uniref:ParB/Sulfiredoxin domain-containing protein n=1 Tax=Saccharopolyspora cebuensis TaxID=418759 RepID=A0ABV4CR27_9PSEU